MNPAMASAPSTSPLRQLLNDRFSQLSLEVDSLFTDARERSRSEFADQLNQAVRRIRQAADLDELGATPLDAAGALASGAAWFRITGEAARGERIRGVPEEAAEASRALEIPLSSAAAMAGAVESRDPVIAATTPREVSEALAKLLGHPPDGAALGFSSHSRGTGGDWFAGRAAILLRRPARLGHSDGRPVPVVLDRLGKAVVAIRNKDGERCALGPRPVDAQRVEGPALKQEHDLPSLSGEYAAIVDAPQSFSFSPEHCRDNPVAVYQDHAGEGIFVLTGELDQDEASVCRQTRD
jgi:hypothetical protein